LCFKPASSVSSRNSLTENRSYVAARPPTKRIFMDLQGNCSQGFHPNELFPG
jgi:hypothetical protein